MEDKILQRDAYRLLVSIGGKVQQWILDHARASREARKSDRGGQVRIEPADIRQSLAAFLSEGTAELRELTSAANGGAVLRR